MEGAGGGFTFFIQRTSCTAVKVSHLMVAFTKNVYILSKSKIHNLYKEGKRRSVCSKSFLSLQYTFIPHIKAQLCTLPQNQVLRTVLIDRASIFSLEYFHSFFLLSILIFDHSQSIYEPSALRKLFLGVFHFFEGRGYMDAWGVQKFLRFSEKS